MELRHRTQLGQADRSARRAPLRVAGRRPVAAGQAGVGLVESLVAVALLSTVVLALASGMLSLLGTSRANAQTQKLQAAVTAWTESLKVIPYEDCATPADYDLANPPAGWTAPTNGTATVTAVEHWQPDPAGFGTFGATCPTGAGAADAGAQRITVDVATAEASTTAQIVVRRPVAGVGP
jgi:Tfp pilus assembly protein PilV